MHGIKTIKIKGFKAFSEEFELRLGGKHLLMYGENGSGKSSIYYALHCLQQSSLKTDAGKKYFAPNNNQNLLNKYSSNEDAHISVDIFNEICRYNLNKDGYTPKLLGGALADFPLDSCFINHLFISRFFNFRNSEKINLFPVFLKDILSFYKVAEYNVHIGKMYDYLTSRQIPTKKKEKELFNLQIESFNLETKRVIENINMHASDRYNRYFKDNQDCELKIRLRYDSNTDKPDNDSNEYWLKYDNIFELQTIRGVRSYKRSPYKKWNTPYIGLEVSEKGNDGNFQLIPKPQSYFNEAKLTAIALSIRFALLDLEKAEDGRFLALDDMLISLDMSNRTKVVDFLLDISDKYKIYLFTHDRAFFNYVCREIQQHGKSKEWVYKTISYNTENREPIIIDEYSDYISKSKHFYSIGDYDTSAIYLRKQLEQSVGELLPYELKVKAGGGFVELQTLWDKLVTFYSNNRKPIDASIQKLFNDSKLLILNVAAHYQRLSNPIYRIELDKVFKLVEYIKSLDKISNKLVIERGKQIIFHHPKENYQCSFELDSDLEIVQDEHIVAKIPKCRNIKWSYNGVDNWDFKTNMRNDNNMLLTSTPKITKFFSDCCEKLPLGITHDMLMKHCKIEGTTSLLDYLGGIDLLRLSIKTY